MLDWAAKQCYIALANMMTAAAFMKIDSCPIEGFKEKELNQLLASDFNIDTSEFKIAYMVAFGYRTDPQPQKTRQAIEDIVYWY